MSMSARNHRCDDCRKPQCDCDCDDNSVIISQEQIDEDRGFCTAVNGNYQADSDDEVVHVLAAVPQLAVPAVPTITLPDPGSVERECAHITIVTQNTNAVIAGLNDDGKTVNGQVSNGTRFLTAYSAVTFWLSEGVEDDPCSCASKKLWIAEARDLRNAT